MTFWWTWLLTFVYNVLLHNVKLVQKRLIHWMYLIGIILNPLLCFIVIEMSLALRMMMGWLSYFLWIHFIEHLFWWIKLVLFLYYIALVNIGSFKPWWFNMMFTEWRAMTFFSFRSYSFNILHFFVLFLLLFFVEYFIKVTTIV